MTVINADEYAMGETESVTERSVEVLLEAKSEGKNKLRAGLQSPTQIVALR